MTALILYLFLSIMATFAGSYVAVMDNLNGLSEEQINQIVEEIMQEEQK